MMMRVELKISCSGLVGSKAPESANPIVKVQRKNKAGNLFEVSLGSDKRGGGKRSVMQLVNKSSMSNQAILFETFLMYFSVAFGVKSEMKF